MNLATMSPVQLNGLVQAWYKWLFHVFVFLQKCQDFIQRAKKGKNLVAFIVHTLIFCPCFFPQVQTSKIKHGECFTAYLKHKCKNSDTFLKQKSPEKVNHQAIRLFKPFHRKADLFPLNTHILVIMTRIPQNVYYRQHWHKSHTFLLKIFISTWGCSLSARTSGHYAINKHFSVKILLSV